MNIMANNLSSCSEGAISHHTRVCVGLRRLVLLDKDEEESCFFSSPIRIGLSAFEPMSKSIKYEVEKGVPMPGRKTASTFKSRSSPSS